MCKERWRTRDLLYEYALQLRPRAAGLSLPSRPHTARLCMIYPWENTSLTIFLNDLFNFAVNSGFTGTKEDFKYRFGAYLQNKPIIYDLFENFPEEGEYDKLYFDLEEKILYYWDTEYIPINAMLIANTTIEGGEA